MTNINTNANATLSLEDLTAVNGGTFTENKFPTWAYERAGFICNFHFLARDEFILNGRTYHEDEANAIMEQMGWKVYKEYTYDLPNDPPYHYRHVYHNDQELFED